MCCEIAESLEALFIAFADSGKNTSLAILVRITENVRHYKIAEIIEHDCELTIVLDYSLSRQR